MSHRPDDQRQAEWTRWVAVFPGASDPPDEPGHPHQVSRYPLRRPVLTMILILAAAALLGGSGYLLFGTGTPSLSAEHEAVTGTLNLNGTICCIERYEAQGMEYLLVTVLEPPGFFSDTSHDVTMRVVAMHDDRDGGMEEIAALEAPIASTLPGSMAIVADTLFVPLGVTDASGHGVWAVDISDPDSPRGVGVHAGRHRYLNMAAGRHNTLIAHSALGFTIYDVSDRQDPNRIGTLERPQADARHIQMDASGLLAYHGDLAGPIFLWDFSDPEHTEPLGRYGDQMSMRSQPPVSGGRITTADVLLERYAPPGRFHDFALHDRHLYVAASEGGLDIVDLSDPTEPVSIDTLALDQRAVRIALASDLLYVVTAGEESRERLAYSVFVFDISDSRSPILMQTIDGIRGVPGRQAIIAAEGYVLLGLNDTLLWLEPSRSE